MTHDSLQNKPDNSPGTKAGSFLPKRPAMFYGWWIVIATSLMTMLTNGFVALGFTALFEPIANSSGWNYTQVSLAASLRGIDVGLFGPIMGFFVDRFGPKRLVATGIVLVSVGLFFLSRITTLTGFYMSYILIAIGMSFASPVVTLTSVAYWFRKKLGIATGIAASGFAVGGGLLVPLVVKLVDIFGWRHAVLIIGGIILVTCLPLSLVLRHRPERYGLQQDGERVVKAPAGAPVTVEPVEDDFTVKRAIASAPFWHIGLAMMFLFMAISTVTAHIMPYLTSIGIDRSTASFIAMSIPLVSVVGRIGAGVAGDRFNKKWVATALFALAFFGLFSNIFTAFGHTWLLVPFIIFFAIGWGGSTTARVAIIREYYGSGHFGSVFGLCMGMAALGTIMGPIFAGWIFDTFGSYELAWPILSALVLAGMFILGTIRVPAKAR